jgi:hypothetical protein
MRTVKTIESHSLLASGAVLLALFVAVALLGGMLQLPAPVGGLLLALLGLRLAAMASAVAEKPSAEPPPRATTGLEAHRGPVQLSHA